MVEHHSGNREIVVDRTDPRHTVYIYNCHNCVVQVRIWTGTRWEHVFTAERVGLKAAPLLLRGRFPTVNI